MVEFLRTDVDGTAFELLVDARLFRPDIVMRAAYMFLDRGYFFFRLDADGNIIVQCTAKIWVDISAETTILDYSDELLNTLLRSQLEKENKKIRETIVSVAIGSSLDTANFVRLDTDRPAKSVIDFDRDIDDIIREIENDPELRVDEAEIDRILTEIETETNRTRKPEEIIVDPKEIIVDPNKAVDAKKKFSSRK